MEKKSIHKEIYKEEQIVYFGLTCRQHGKLTDEIQDKGIEVLKSFINTIEIYKESVKLDKAEYLSEDFEINAIGTEIFRKAVNGQDYLDRVKNETGINVRLISQEKEAELGYLTGKAAFSSQFKEKCEHIDLNSLVVYDSGGGSFQLTKLKENDINSNSLEFDTFLRSYASAHAFEDIMKIKDEDEEFKESGKNTDLDKRTPNPISLPEAEILIEKVKVGALIEEGKTTIPEWLKGKEIVHISGLNGIGKMASMILESNEFTVADMRDKALPLVLEKSDEELFPKYCDFENSEPPSQVVPKLCLILAVCEALGISKVYNCSAVGSCPGLLIEEI